LIRQLKNKTGGAAFTCSRQKTIAPNEEIGGRTEPRALLSYKIDFPKKCDLGYLTPGEPAAAEEKLRTGTQAVTPQNVTRWRTV
jgi:hypothetical protein